MHTWRTTAAIYGFACVVGATLISGCSTVSLNNPSKTNSGSNKSGKQPTTKSSEKTQVKAHPQKSNAYFFGVLHQTTAGKYQLVYQNVNSAHQVAIAFTSDETLVTVIVPPGKYRLKAWYVLDDKNHIIASKSLEALIGDSQNQASEFPFAKTFSVVNGHAYYIGQFKVTETQVDGAKANTLEYSLKDVGSYIERFKNNYRQLQPIDIDAAYSLNY